MNRTVRDRNDRHPKPVKRIELFEKYPKGRLILTILLILIGVGALGYSLIGYLTADTGWTTIEAASSELNCSDELIFQYDIGAGELPATAEKKQSPHCIPRRQQRRMSFFTRVCLLTG